MPYVALSCLVLPCLLLYHVVLPGTALNCLVLYFLIMPHLITSYHTLPYIVSSNNIIYCLWLSHPFFFVLSNVVLAWFDFYGITLLCLILSTLVFYWIACYGVVLSCIFLFDTCSSYVIV